jgi:haloacetate dehalogenase
MSNSLKVWHRWADSVEGGPLPSGHFIPEEAPDQLLASLRGFLEQGPTLIDPGLR